MLNISANSATLAVAAKVKKVKGEKQLRWMVCRIGANPESADSKAEAIVVNEHCEEDPKDQASDPAAYTAFYKALANNGIGKIPSYGIIRYGERMFFVSWIPENAKIGLKMKASTCRETFKNQLTGIQENIQATSAEELNEEVFKALVDKSKK